MSDSNIPLDFLNPADYEYIESNIGKNSFELANLVTSSPSNLMPDSDSFHLFGLYNDTTLQIKSEETVEEETAYIENIGFPPSYPTDLCSTDYAGPLSFEVFVDPNGLKNPWEYSFKCNKLYIDMKCKFPINFIVKPDGNLELLYIRVLPMYEEDRHVQELVHRCYNHAQPTDPHNQGISEQMAQHILRCDNSSAQYYGDKNANKRLSIVIPLSKPQVGTDSVKEFFQFVCKNSCPGGMNRRPIQVIFTLENVEGTVLGRRVLCVRICSCPKRDREKDEAKVEKHTAEPRGKKRKVEKVALSPGEQVDTRTFPVNFNIVGKKAYDKLLSMAHAIMAQEVMHLENKKMPSAIFRKCANDISDLISKSSETDK